jgi:hypothetical protein
MAERHADGSGKPTGPRLKRRGILAVAGAAIAGIVAAQASRQADAAPITGGTDGGALIIGGGGGGCSCSPNTTTFGTTLISTNGGFPAFVGSNTGNGGTGVQGVSQTGYGVGGYSGGVGIYGLSSGSYGIVGITTAGAPFSGITGSASTAGAAAFAGGTSTPGAYAAYFTGPVVVDGSFTVVNPANKHGAIKHLDGSYRLLYSMESPESWVEDFGKGTLIAGKVTVTLDADFAAIADTSDYAVFAMPLADCKGLYVANQSPSGFEVQELQSGASNAAFRYRIVAKPKSEAKVQRLAKFTVPTIKIPTLNDLPKPPAFPSMPKQP